MEFEKNAPVSDEARRLAETKKVTLKPIHGDVAPEELSDSVVAAQHINGQPIANVGHASEQNTPLVQPSKEILAIVPPEKKTGVFGLLALVAGLLIAATGIIIALIYN
jgi:hypothetical protein